MIKTTHIKYNNIVIGLYNFILNLRTKNVKSYIFVATTGRSGSQSLSHIFSIIKRAKFLHEPYPIMNIDYLEKVDTIKYYEEIFRKIKRINIKRQAAGFDYYIETNHQFIKNYAEFAIKEFGQKIKIIHIVRDPIKVASSFYSIDSIPGKYIKGESYLINPEENSNHIKMDDLLTKNSDYNHDFYKCIWYWYEIEYRIKYLKKKYQNVLWYDIETDSLNEKSEIKKMFHHLKLPPDVDFDQIVGTRVNLKKNLKLREIEPNQALDMHNHLVSKMEERYGQKFWI